MNGLEVLETKSIGCTIWIGQAIGLIHAIKMHGKPIGELGGMRGKRSDILEDLQGCLRLEGNPKGVSPWIRRSSNGRFSFGYYSQPWTLRALDFIYKTKLKHTDHSWISGLLFGYRIELIQEFIDNGNRARPKRKGKPSRA